MGIPEEHSAQYGLIRMNTLVRVKAHGWLGVVRGVYVDESGAQYRVEHDAKVGNWEVSDVVTWHREEELEVHGDGKRIQS